MPWTVISPGSESWTVATKTVGKKFVDSRPLFVDEGDQFVDAVGQETWVKKLKSSDTWSVADGS